MIIIRSAFTVFSVVAALAAISVPAHASNLLTNGDFETSDNGFSETQTPVSWTNVGHNDGVIAYSVFGTPAYNGNYFYDLGGYGNPLGPVGDGITQTVATNSGQAYTLAFGLTSENNSDLATQLTVIIGGQSTAFNLTDNPSYGELAAPFSTETISYVATGTSTAISFIETANGSNGNNDPLIDGVSFASSSASAVPEPATWAMMLFGMGAIGIAVRRRQAVRITYA
jgi:hypothetical protein